jgi:hypothetical protein
MPIVLHPIPQRHPQIGLLLRRHVLPPRLDVGKGGIRDGVGATTLLRFTAGNCVYDGRTEGAVGIEGACSRGSQARARARSSQDCRPQHPARREMWSGEKVVGRSRRNRKDQWPCRRGPIDGVGVRIGRCLLGMMKFWQWYDLMRTTPYLNTKELPICFTVMRNNHSLTSSTSFKYNKRLDDSQLTIDNILEHGLSSLRSRAGPKV